MSAWTHTVRSSTVPGSVEARIVLAAMAKKFSHPFKISVKPRKACKYSFLQVFLKLDSWWHKQNAENITSSKRFRWFWLPSLMKSSIDTLPQMLLDSCSESSKEFHFWFHGETPQLFHYDIKEKEVFDSWNPAAFECSSLVVQNK